MDISKLVRDLIITQMTKRAENRIRTDDPRITNALLYQLSYPGVKIKVLQSDETVANNKLDKIMG